MSMQFQSPLGDGVSAPPLWFLSTLTWIRAHGGLTGGQLSLVEQVIPAGFPSPWHLHQDEDESFYVIDGELTVIVGDKRVVLRKGDFAFGPRQIPHGFRVTSDKPARILLLSTGANFANFVAETSELAPQPEMPAPAEPDIPRLIATAEKFGIKILGPMPD